MTEMHSICAILLLDNTLRITSLMGTCENLIKFKENLNTIVIVTLNVN